MVGGEQTETQANKDLLKMTEADEEALKAEIDEIMNRVDAIMDNIARVLPEQKEESDGGE